MSRLLVIPLGLLLLVSASFIWSRGGLEKPADFTFINRGEVGTLDPNRMSWLQDIRVGYALWEGLYALDPKTLDAVLGTADRVDISPDKTTYKFHIRDSAKWSNGDPVRAADFVFAWRRMLEEPGDYTYLFHYIQGAQDYEEAYAKFLPVMQKYRSEKKLAEENKRDGKPFVEPTKPDAPPFDARIVAANDRTFEVKLKHPVTFFPDLCAFPPFFPLHEKSIDLFRQEDGSYRREFTRPPALVSNGPYRLARWDFKRRIRLDASPYYWDHGNVKSHAIEIVSVEDPMSAFLKYETGSVDWLAEVTGEIAAELKAKDRKDLHVFSGFGTYFYSFNCQDKLPDGGKNPFADAKVRQAFTMAIDKKQIVDTVTRMGEPVAVNYIPPGVFTKYQSPAGLAYDVAKAQKLLAEAGFPDGKGFPRVTVLFNKEGQHGDIAQNVRRQWLQNLNVDLELESVEIKVFRDRLHKKDYAVARASWIGDYNDPSTFTDKYLSVSDNNDSAWKSTPYDDLCAKAAVETDEVKRLEMFTQAEKILCDEAPIIPIYHYVNAYLFESEDSKVDSRKGRLVSGVPLNARNMVVFKSVERDADMGKFIAFRVLQFPLILAVIYVITFLLAWVAPGDPFERNDKKLAPAVLDGIKKRMHAESPVSFLANYPRNILIKGDFGPSFTYEEYSVNDILKSALPVSITLGLMAILIGMVGGVAIGTLAAVRRGGMFDWFSLSIALIGISLPSFVAASLLLSIFSVRFKVFPVGTWGTMSDAVLPAVALSLAPMAYIARLMRVSMIDVLSSDYVRTARAKGLAKSRVVWKHCLRNAFLPVLSYLGPAAAVTLTGSFVVEKVFNVPGLGQHFVNSVLNRDQTLILGTVMVYSVFLLSFNLLVDVTYAFVDPRIDVTAKAP